jgi:hypothetical protein
MLLCGACCSGTDSLFDKSVVSERLFFEVVEAEKKREDGGTSFFSDSACAPFTVGPEPKSGVFDLSEPNMEPLCEFCVLLESLPNSAFDVWKENPTEGSAGADEEFPNRLELEVSLSELNEKPPCVGCVLFAEGPDDWKNEVVGGAVVAACGVPNMFVDCDAGCAEPKIELPPDCPVVLCFPELKKDSVGFSELFWFVEPKMELDPTFEDSFCLTDPNIELAPDG